MACWSVKFTGTFNRSYGGPGLVASNLKETAMKTTRLLIVISLILAGALSVTAKTKEEKQAEARQKAQQTLAKLYKARPSAEAAVKRAAGYAVFNSSGMKILIAGGGKGKGIAVDNATQKVTYMKMREVQAGLGMGVKKFSVIFVFETKKAFDNFVEGNWEFGGQTTAEARTGSGGG